MIFDPEKSGVSFLKIFAIHFVAMGIVALLLVIL